MESHRAGSPGDQALANKILKKFKEYGLTTWSDEHFVKVQEAPASGYNKFVFKGANEERPQSFLSYSPSQSVRVMKQLLSAIISSELNTVKSQKIIFCYVLVQAPVLYAQYGEESDFTQLQKSGIGMDGKVMLVRAGKISFAEKVGVFVQKRADYSHLTCLTCEPFIYSFPLQQVANAAKVNASAVLIFPDRDDYQFEESEDATELFGHVSVKTVLLRSSAVHI